MLKRVLLSLCLLSMTVAGLTVVPAGPASAGLSPTRLCKNFETGDHHRMLSVCSRVWIADPSPTQSRGVVEMHSYVLVSGHWTDVTSQSITINEARFTTYDINGDGLATRHYGNNVSSSTCRVNSPSSSYIACSVPNIGRVAFYGKAFDGIAQSFRNEVRQVSWRDDAGQPHTVKVGDNSYPDKLPIIFDY
jgi:hypothetical protein